MAQPKKNVSAPLLPCGSPQLTLTDSRSGRPSLRVSCGGGEKLLHSSYDPEKEAAELVRRCDFSGTGLLVVLGLGLGYHLAALLNRFPTAQFIVVEALPECVRLARREQIVVLNDARITCITGCAAENVLQRVTELQLKNGMPPLALFSLPAAAAAFPDYYHPLKEQLTASSSLDLAGRLRYGKFAADGLRVLLFDCGYFLTREVTTALRRLGHQVVTLPFTEKTPVKRLLADLVRQVAAARPDFCLTINHLGFDDEGILTGFLDSLALPCASWFVDSPELIISGTRNVSPYTAIFTWDSSYIAAMKQAGFETVSYLPLGSDPEVFHPRAEKGMPPQATIPVGFVGTSMVARLQEKLARVPRSLQPQVELLARQMSRGSNRVAELPAAREDGSRQRLESLSERERSAFETAVTWQATLLYRRDCLQQLRPFRPVIHGDSGWKALLDDAFTLRPGLDYYRQLPAFYCACSINFNATNLQMGTAVNQRLFDVPACGGFLLTDRQQSLEELFISDREVVTYGEPAEIPELVRFYRDNPAAREKIAARGRQRVLGEHTYQHRLRNLVAAMRARYG